MSAVGSCYDNDATESSFGVLKRERINRRHYATQVQIRADVFEYFKMFYNPVNSRNLNKINQTALN